MKTLKTVAVVFAVLVVCLVLLAGLAFLPAVQTWAVKRAMAGDPSVEFDVARVAAGLGRAEVTGLRIVQHGVVVRVPRLEVNYSAPGLLFARELRVQRLVARGIEVDAARAVTAPAREPSPPFAGLLLAIELPMAIHVGDIALDAAVRLPGAGADGPARTLWAELTGGAIAPGATGEIRLQGRLVDPAPDSPVGAVDFTARLGLRQTDNRRFDRATLAATVGASGLSLPVGRSLDLRAEVDAAEGSGRETTAVRAELVEGDRRVPVLALDTTYTAGAQQLAGEWKLSLGREDAAAFLAGLPVPELAFEGDGTFTLVPDRGDLAARGRLRADVRKLEAVQPELAAVGRMALAGEFDFALAGGTARLAQLAIDVADGSGRTVLAVQALQPVSFEVDAARVAFDRPDSDLLRLEIAGLPVAWARPFAPADLALDGGELTGAFAVAATPDGARVVLRALQPFALDTLTVRGAGAAEPLLDRASFSVSPRIDYTADRVRALLPDFALTTAAGDRIDASANVDVALGASPAVSFGADLRARLPALLAPWLPPGVGPLGAFVRLEGRQAGDEIAVRTLQAKLDAESGTTLLELTALQPFTLDAAAHRLRAERAEAPVVRVELGRVPLAWVQPFVADSRLSGETRAGVVLVGVEGETLAVRTETPMQLAGISVALGGEELLRQVDFAADFAATLAADRVAGELRQVRMSAGGATLLELTGRGELRPGEQPTFSGQGRAMLDAAALRQPAFAAYNTLARGRVTAEFDARGGTAGDAMLKAKLEARDLVAHAGNQPLGSLQLGLDAKRTAAGAVSVRAPLVVENSGRRSDVSLAAELSPAPAGGWSVQGKASGQRLFVDDVQALAALAPAEASSTAPSGPAAPRPTPDARDEQPFWSGVRGRLELAFDEVVYGAAYTVRQLDGLATIEERRLAVERFSGQFRDSPLTARMVVTFDPAAAAPYAMQGSFRLPQFDMGAFLREANPRERPALESVFDVTSEFSGTGRNRDELLARTQGRFDFTGGNGVLRAFARREGAATLVTGVLGAFASRSDNEWLGLVNDLATTLREVPFDRIALRVERGQSLDLELKALELFSPVLRLQGQGRVQHREGVPVANQALQLTAQVAFRGGLVPRMRDYGMVAPEPNEDGFHLLRMPFTLGGTLANPDASQLYTALGSAAYTGFQNHRRLQQQRAQEQQRLQQQQQQGERGSP